MKKFNEIFIDKTKYGEKIQTSEYEKQGKHIIVDQGQAEIAGYTNREEGLFNEVPVIIFGDHTRLIKYIDEPFFLGADGVKVLRSKEKNANYKYLYYALKSAKIPNTGYNRHFKWLKDVEINYPDSVKQEKIVDILDRVSDVIEKRKAELSYLDTLIKARFVEMFGDPIINSKGLETKELNEVLVLKAGDFTAASDISVEPTEINIYPCYGGNGIRGYVAEYNQEGEYSLVGRQGALSGNVQYATGKFKNTEHALLVKPIIRMNSIWLNQLLLNLDLKRYQTGAAQPGLSVKNLQDIQIIMVPIDEQRQFAAFVNEIDKSKLQKFSAA
jgi:type I restriction enzyme S subunit